MKKNMTINILLIDDSEDQLILVEDDLIQAGLHPSIKRVDSEHSLKECMLHPALWDIALLDYMMPGFSAENALDILQKMDANLPVIILSGQVSQENAVKMMRLGASDYISKQNNFRLIPSIIREIENSFQRKNQLKTEQKLRETEKKLAAVVMAAQDGILLLDEKFRIDFWNEGATRITAYSEDEILGKNFTETFIPEELQESFLDHVKEIKVSAKSVTQEYTFLVKEGGKSTVELSLSTMEIGSYWTVICIIRDINQRKRLEDKLKSLAIHDSLTGLINRRELIHCLNNEIKRAVRYQLPLSLFFIDIDHFKKINDDYGHLCGDEILIELAKLMKNSMRELDIIGRYGGEEFLIILPETPKNRALELAERLRSLAANKKLECSNKTILNITLSIGVSEFNSNNASLEYFIDSADKAMYQAKKQGRNRVCVYGDK